MVSDRLELLCGLLCDSVWAEIIPEEQEGK